MIYLFLKKLFEGAKVQCANGNTYDVLGFE
jgi:hypothetical protein